VRAMWALPDRFVEIFGAITPGMSVLRLDLGAALTPVANSPASVLPQVQVNSQPSKQDLGPGKIEC